MKKHNIISVRLNNKGLVDGEIIRINPTTIWVRLLHDNSVIKRKRKRDLKEE